MNVLNELLDGTRPSPHLILTLDVERFGVLFTLHQLRFKGLHASRILFEQLDMGQVIVQRSSGGYIALIHDGDWGETIQFTVEAVSTIR